MKTYTQMMEDMYSADYKLDKNGKKHQARRIAFNYGDDDKEAQKKDKAAAKGKVEEKLDLKKADMGDVITDFRKSDAPQFKGKSDEKKREMAIAAKLQADDASKNEEVEQMDESFDPSEIASNPRMYSADSAKKAYYHKKASESDKQSLARHLDRYHGNKEWRKPVKEEKDEQEYGYEGAMAMTQLKTIVRHSEHLMEMLEPDTDLPEWVQSKITLATDYMQTAHDYLMSEMNEGWDDMLKYAKEKNKPQPNGGAGKKEGSRYGGSKQKDEPVKEDIEEAYVNQAGTGRSKQGYHDAGMFDKATAEKHAKTHNGTVHQDASGKHYVKSKKLRREEVEQIEENWLKAIQHRSDAKRNLELAKSVSKDSNDHKHYMHKYHSSMIKHIQQAHAAGKYGSKAEASADIKDHTQKAKQYKSGGSVHEEAEQINELSKGTLGSYIKKAADSAAVKRKIGSDFEHMADKSKKPANKAAATALADKYKSASRDRRANIGKAVDRLTKEEIEQVEEEHKYVVKYNNPKSEKHGGTSAPLSQAAAHKKAEMGNKVDKTGGKYTVHKINAKGHMAEASEPPFDGPYKKVDKNNPQRNSDGSITSPMSKVKQLAKQAMNNAKKTVAQHKEGVDIDSEGNLLEVTNKITFHQFMGATKKKPEKKGGSNAPEQV